MSTEHVKFRLFSSACGSSEWEMIQWPELRAGKQDLVFSIQAALLLPSGPGDKLILGFQRG